VGFALEHGHLLVQGQNFEGGVTPTVEEDAQGRQDGENEFQHELRL
jgi:hypothetical protein